MEIKNAKDFWAGLMFIAFGLGFAIVAGNYQMGTSVRMGPAYFPTVLGGVLAVLGLVIFLRSFVSRFQVKVPRFAFRPLALVLGSIVLFGLLLQPLGLILSTIVLVFVGAYGGHEFRWKEVLVLAILLAAFAIGVFYYGLGLPFNLWPQALS